MTDAAPTPAAPAPACAAVRELLIARALGALEATQEALVTEHLAACAACGAAEGEARADLALVRDPAVKAPAGAWGRLQERLAAQKAGDDPVRAGPVVVAVSCSFCRGALVRANAVYCASCLAPHHPECWREHGRCSVMGCAETRVVRPSDTPDAAPQPGRLIPFDPRKAAAQAEDEAPVRRRRAAGLGALVALLGGGAVAALYPREQPLAPAPTPPPAPTVAPPPAPAEPPRLDVDVREASLGALLAEIEKVAGVRVDVSPSLNDLLIRDGRWRDQRWDSVVAEVAEELDLAVQSAGGPRAPKALQLIPQGPPILERARSNLQTTSTMLVSRRPEETTRDLRAGPPHTVWASPDGQALALVEGRRATIVRRDGSVEGPLELPGRDAQVTWSKGPQADAAEPTFVLPAGAVRRGPAGTAAGSWLWTPLPERGAREARGGITPLAACAGRSDEAIVRVIGPFVVTATRVLLLRATSVVDLRLDPGPLGLVAACGPGRLLRVEGDALELLEVDAAAGTTKRRWSVAAAIQPPLDGKGEARQAEAPAHLSAAGEHLLLVSANVAEVRRLSDGAPVGATLERKRQTNWSASLSPDGRRVAWTDALAFVREADGEALLAGPFQLEHAESVVWGATWSPDGRGLALFSRPAGAMGVVDLEASRGAKSRQVPIAYAVDGISDVRWLGGSIAVQSVNATLRREHVRVCVAGAPEIEVKLEVVSDEPPPAGEAPPASEPPPPPPPASEAPAPRAPEPPAALPPSVAHVRVGQRWRFELSDGQVKTWDVLAVAPDLVTYRETLTLRGRVIGEPVDLTWAARRPEAFVYAPGARREPQALGGRRFDCAVVAVGDACTWTLVDGARTVFPGEIRYERGGKLMWRLAEVEGP